MSRADYVGAIHYTDRYGGRGPDPDTICKGPCEGMGCFPAHPSQLRRAEDAPYRELWMKAEAERVPVPTVRRWQHELAHDGYHFLRCLDCDGTGKAKGDANE